MPDRLDQFVSQRSALSRREAKRAVGAGRVTVDGVPCRDAARKVSEADRVCLDDQPLAAAGPRYLMLHKPAGVVSATRDSDHPTVLDLLPPDLARGLHLVGRLDRDTTGLLLLTDDGQWSHRITSPRRDCPKTYRVDLAEPLTDDAARQLAEGLVLNGEDRPTRPAIVTRLAPDRIELTIAEGRYHQVKRMLGAVGNRVTALHRLRVGAIALDPALAPGDFRALSQDEITSVA